MRARTAEGARRKAPLQVTISGRIESLPNLNKSELVQLWLESFGQPMPSHLRKQLIVPILAYRMQEQEYGGLSHSARRRLREIAASLPSRKGKDRPMTIKSGTRLIRSWQGEVHEVNVNDHGFSYRSQQYSSLSKIAREITGTQWSGPAFFGVDKKAS